MGISKGRGKNRYAFTLKPILGFNFRLFSDRLTLRICLKGKPKPNANTITIVEDVLAVMP